MALAARIRSADEKWGRYCYRPHSHRRWVPEGTLIAWRVSFCSSPRRVWPSGYVARRSRRCRTGAWSNQEARRLVPTGLAACPQPGLSPNVSSGSTSQQAALLPIDAGVHHSDQPMAVRLRSQQSGMALPEGSVFPFLLRDDAVIASSSLRFPLSWFGRRSREAIRFRSRYLEDARVDRVGQGRERRLIHFWAKCQWTRVDKSTAHRKA